jgi:hypothetical protein
MSILSALFGGSKNSSNSTSKNLAYGDIKGATAAPMQAGFGGITRLGNALSGGFDDYLDQSGFDFALGEGFKGITGAGAAKGLLRSGGTSKALATYADGMKRRAYDNYLNMEANLGQLGIGAGSLLSNAGQVSESTSKGSQNNGILTSLFSDRSIKTDIVRHVEVIPGLYLYTFRYFGLDLTPQIGFMADEVEKLFPEAIGEAVYPPTGQMRKTVNYDIVLEKVRDITMEGAA